MLNVMLVIASCMSQIEPDNSYWCRVPQEMTVEEVAAQRCEDEGGFEVIEKGLIEYDRKVVRFKCVVKKG